MRFCLDRCREAESMKAVGGRFFRSGIRWQNPPASGINTEPNNFIAFIHIYLPSHAFF